MLARLTPDPASGADPVNLWSRPEPPVPSDLPMPWPTTWTVTLGPSYTVDARGRVVVDAGRRSLVIDPATGTTTREPAPAAPPPPARAIAVHPDGRQEELALDQHTVRPDELGGYQVFYRAVVRPTMLDPAVGLPVVFADSGEGSVVGRSQDGRYSYALEQRRSPAAASTHFVYDLAEACLDRLSMSPPRLTRLRCFLIEGNPGLAVSADTRRAALVLPRTEADGFADLLWIDLADGAVLATWRGRWTSPAYHWARLDDRGRLTMPTDRGLAVVDLTDGQVWHVDLGAAVGTVLPARSRLADGRQVLLRAGDDDVTEVIAVDLDQVLATATAVPPPTIPGGDPERPVASAVARFWETPTPCARGGQLRQLPHWLGTEYACVDRAGRRDGDYAVVGADGPVISGRYQRDRRTGVWRAWDAFGGAISSATMVNDRVHGPHRRWHAGGALRERSRWHDDRRIWIEARYAGGALFHTLDWVDGERREAFWTPGGEPWPCQRRSHRRADLCD